MKHVILIALILTGHILNAQKTESIGLYIQGSDTVQFSFSPHTIWKGNNTLSVERLNDKQNIQISAKDVSAVYLENSLVKPHHLSGELLFFQYKVYNGKLKLLYNGYTKHYYLKNGELINELTLQDFMTTLKADMSDCSKALALLERETIQPEKLMFHSAFFKSIIDTYNSCDNENSSANSKPKKIKYRPIRGIEIGVNQSFSGFSFGYFGNKFYTKNIAFDFAIKVMKSEGEINSKHSVVGFRTYETENVYLVVPLGMRYFPSRKKIQPNFFLGATCGYGSLSYVNSRQVDKRKTDLLGGLYIGAGVLLPRNNKSLLGMDLKLETTGPFGNAKRNVQLSIKHSF